MGAGGDDAGAAVNGIDHLLHRVLPATAWQVANLDAQPALEIAPHIHIVGMIQV